MFFGLHRFYFIAFGLWLALLAVRSLVWRIRRRARCERCGHVGLAVNKPVGTWKSELIRFVLFVPPGFFVYILMGIYLSYFVMRWFVVRTCANCGSEKLVYGKHIHGAGA